MIRSAYVTLLLMLNAAVANAAVVTFDPPPCDNCERGVTTYFEDGILFTGSYSHYGMGIVGNAINGSTGAVRIPVLSMNHSIQFLDGSAFTLKSVDLAEYMVSSSFSVQPISFTGVKTNDSTVTESFTLDGIIDGQGGANDFQTFSFTDQFTDLKYVTFNSNGFSMDNMVISSVPVPPAIWLFLSGVVALIGISKRKS